MAFARAEACWGAAAAAAAAVERDRVQCGGVGAERDRTAESVVVAVVVLARMGALSAVVPARLR